MAFALVIGLMLGPVAARIEARGISPYISAVLVFILFVFSVCLIALALVGPLSYWADRGPQMWQELQLRLSQLREPDGGAARHPGRPALTRRATPA